jgi:hypothetical protein
MSLRAVVVLLVSLAGGTAVVAQKPLEWLSGDWAEKAAKPKGKAAAGPPDTFLVEVAGGILRIRENGADGDDIRCRLDGMEIQYRQTKPKATVDYMLECEIGPQSVEVTGLFTAGGIEGFPPREFELRKKYELATDGSVHRQNQLWGIIPGIGRIGLSNTTARFSRKQ